MHHDRDVRPPCMVLSSHSLTNVLAFPFGRYFHRSSNTVGMGYSNKFLVALAATLCAAAVVYANSDESKSSADSLVSIWVCGFSRVPNEHSHNGSVLLCT